MDVSEASQIVLNATGHDYGNFYGGALSDQQPLGVGQIFDNVRFPILDIDELLYDTAEGLVYILTHECDISSDNKRPYNDFAVICPIIQLDACIGCLDKTLPSDVLISFLARLGKDEISRVAYFPSIPDFLPNGGIVYLNQISHTHVNAFNSANAKRVTSLTTNGLRIIDYKLTNHLLRPKATALSLLRY